MLGEVAITESIGVIFLEGLHTNDILTEFTLVPTTNIATLDV